METILFRGFFLLVMALSAIILVIICFTCYNSRKFDDYKLPCPIRLFSLILLYSSLFYISILSLVENEKPKVSDLIESNNQKQELINAYHDYYYCSEQLLDSLDTKYNWCDAFDPEEYYDAKSKIYELYEK